MTAETILALQQEQGELIQECASLNRARDIIDSYPPLSGMTAEDYREHLRKIIAEIWCEKSRQKHGIDEVLFGRE